LEHKDSKLQSPRYCTQFETFDAIRAAGRNETLVQTVPRQQYMFFFTTLFLSLKKSNFLVFFYMNQQGEVSKITKGSRVTYTTSGIIDVVNDTTLKIRDLPINTSMENYENKLKSFMGENDKFIKVTD